MPTMAENSKEVGNRKSAGIELAGPKKLKGELKVSIKLTSSPSGS